MEAVWAFNTVAEAVAAVKRVVAEMFGAVRSPVTIAVLEIVPETVRGTLAVTPIPI